MAARAPVREDAPAGDQKFARILQRLRAKRGLSQGTVADRCRLELGHVEALERAEVEADAEDLIKLATVLDVSIDELMRGVTAKDFA